MKEPQVNKKLEPAENKQQLVKIKMRAHRAASGVTADANGFAFVDPKTAERLVAMQYADMAEEELNHD